MPGARSDKHSRRGGESGKKGVTKEWDFDFCNSLHSSRRDFQKGNGVGRGETSGLEWGSAGGAGAVFKATVSNPAEMRARNHVGWVSSERRPGGVWVVKERRRHYLRESGSICFRVREEWTVKVTGGKDHYAEDKKEMNGGEIEKRRLERKFTLTEKEKESGVKQLRGVARRE